MITCSICGKVIKTNPGATRFVNGGYVGPECYKKLRDSGGI